MGVCYLRGIGAEEDHTKAKALFKSAAELNHPSAITYLGMCAEMAGDDKEALEFYEKAAKLGNTTAKTYLGDFFRAGIEVKQDKEYAIKLYAEAADRNHPVALLNLAKCYMLGENVKKSERQAILYYKRSAEFGNFEAIKYLANYYFQMKSTLTTNATNAIEYCQQAAQLGDCHALFMLGKIYEEGSGGIGNRPSLKMAVRFYLCAAERKHVQAMLSLGLCYEKSQDPEQAFKWFERAAEEGEPTAIFNLGICYDKGIGVKPDETRALALFEKAAKLGNPYAMTELGHFLYGAKEYKRAFELFFRASEKGDPIAKLNLGICYRDGHAVPQNLLQAFTYFVDASQLGNRDALKEYEKLEKYKDELYKQDPKIIIPELYKYAGRGGRR